MLDSFKQRRQKHRQHQECNESLFIPKGESGFVIPNAVLDKKVSQEVCEDSDMEKISVVLPVICGGVRIAKISVSYKNWEKIRALHNSRTT